tara:strand:+ start:205 stop:402 length:198 start_codon:yes stop_codon:yes gene_type:complete
MEIAIGIILCMTFLGNVTIFILLYLVHKVHQVQEQQVTEICNIEDSIKSINEYLGEEAEAYTNQN